MSLVEAPSFELQALLDAAVDAIILIDSRGLIEVFNQAAERLFGYTASEVVGKHITIIIPKERHAEEDHVLARICRGEAVEHFETIRVRKNGTTLPVSLTVSPIRDASGTVIGANR